MYVAGTEDKQQQTDICVFSAPLWPEWPPVTQVAYLFGLFLALLLAIFNSTFKMELSKKYMWILNALCVPPDYCRTFL